MIAGDLFVSPVKQVILVKKNKYKIVNLSIISEQEFIYNKGKEK